MYKCMYPFLYLYYVNLDITLFLNQLTRIISQISFLYSDLSRRYMFLQGRQMQCSLYNRFSSEYFPLCGFTSNIRALAVIFPRFHLKDTLASTCTCKTSCCFNVVFFLHNVPLLHLIIHRRVFLSFPCNRVDILHCDVHVQYMHTCRCTQNVA